MSISTFIGRLRQRFEIMRAGSKVWYPSNIYLTAKLGRHVSVGRFSEIGNEVVVGDYVRIGAMCFIPEGVVLEKNAWIGPRCAFTNDLYPPSPRGKWQKTVVEEGAALGAGVTVVCGVRIGRGALVGAGSVVTKDIPANEIWAGVPAMKINTKEV